MILSVRILGGMTINIQGRTKKNLVFQQASLMSLPMVGMVKNVFEAHFAKEMKLLIIDSKTHFEHFPVVKMMEICRTSSGALSAKPS